MSRAAKRKSSQMTTRKMETGSDHLLCTVEAHVATITMNNPSSRNSMSEPLVAGLRRMLAELAEDPDVRVLVLTGAGGAFCSGGDISSMAKTLAGGESPDLAPMIEALRDAQNDISLRLYRFPKPTLAALPGPAAGAGMSLALACDMRIACDSAFMTPAFGRIGLSGDFGGSWYLSQLVGPARAKEIYFLSQKLSAADCAELGLVNRVVPDAELAEATAALAAELAEQAPLALRHMKENHNLARESGLQAAMDQEADSMIRTLLSQDHKAAALAFMQKRKPVFHGK